jgi:hypothetical protein
VGRDNSPSTPAHQEECHSCDLRRRLPQDILPKLLRAFVSS